MGRMLLEKRMPCWCIKLQENPIHHLEDLMRMNTESNKKYFLTTTRDLVLLHFALFCHLDLFYVK